MALLLCSLPMILYTVFFQAYNNSGSYIVNVIVLSHSVMLSFVSLYSLLNPMIYCFRNKTFRKTCKELFKMNYTNSNED